MARNVRPLPYALLTLLAFLGNVASVEAFIGMEMLWGSIFTMIVLRLYGISWALLTALLASTWTLVLWNHPWGVLLFVIEVLVVGSLLPPLRNNLVLADAVYWIGLGLALVLLTYRLGLGMEAQDGWLVGLKMAVNGILNALVASLILDHGPLPRPNGTRGVPLRRLLFHVLTVLVLGTGFTLAMVGTHEEQKRLDAELAARMRAAARGIEPHLAQWLYQHLSVVEQMADAHEMALDDPARTQELLERLHSIFGSFLALYVSDENGVTIAFQPPDFYGVSNIGIDYSHRPYFQRAKATHDTVVSSVFYAGPRNNVPIVTLAAPVLEDGRFLGIAVGALDLTALNRMLVEHVGASNLVATLVRPDGTVVASSSPSIEAGTMYPRATITALQPGAWFEWIPPPDLYDFSGRENATLGAVERMGGPADWLLILEAPQGPQQFWIRSRMLRTLGGILGLIVVVLPMAALVASWITRPLQELARRSTDLPLRIEQEPSVVSWPHSRIREIGRLDDNFRAMAEALRVRISEMAANDRAKNEFLAVLGHELRNPLAAIRIAVHMLQTSEEERVRGHAIGVLDRQSQNLSRIIDDLLDLSRITRRKIELRLSRIDARDCLRNALQSIESSVKASQQELVVRISDTPLWVDADSTRLEQIIGNLLTNAVKYTPSGGRIEVDAHAIDGEVVFEVIDNGIGMTPELLARVFEPFQQGAPSGERSRGGLGIGLTLVRQLVDIHGGRVWAHSEGPNRGSRVGFALREATEPESAHPPPAATEQPGPARRVLLVDDNTDAVELLANTLKDWGHEVAVAYDGPQALRAAEISAPDLILLDIGLPGMSGLEVAESLRSSPDFDRTLIVALTGYGHPEDRERSFAAGCDLHITKPIDPEYLRKLLREPPAPRTIRDRPPPR